MRLIIKYGLVIFCISVGILVAADITLADPNTKDIALTAATKPAVDNSKPLKRGTKKIIRRRRIRRRPSNSVNGPTLASSNILSDFSELTGPTLMNTSVTAQNLPAPIGPTLAISSTPETDESSSTSATSSSSSGPVGLPSTGMSGSNSNTVSNSAVTTGPSTPPSPNADNQDKVANQNDSSSTEKVTGKKTALPGPVKSEDDTKVISVEQPIGPTLTTQPKSTLDAQSIGPTLATSSTSSKSSSPKGPTMSAVPAKKEFPDIKEVVAPPTKKEFFTMADEPKTEIEKEYIEQKIKAVSTFDLTHAPNIESVIDIEPGKKESQDVYLGQYIEPWQGYDPTETLEMNFENKEITELLKFLEQNLNVTFILDDYIEPKRAEGLKPLAGTKITFKSNVPLTLKDAWDLGLTFLEMSGFSVIPTTIARTYHVTAASGDKNSANNNPLPTFIGTDSTLLPNSDIKIRYVYFIENAEVDTISKVIETLRTSSSAAPIKFPELRAILITDKAANIKSMLKILNEIDKIGTPEMLSIIRLRHADATDVQKLYQELIGKDQKGQQFPFRPRKPSTTHYFTEATRVFADPRTNSLIILGTRDNIKRFEDFISVYIDKKPDLPYSPLYIYPLRYIEAESIADILNKMIQQFNSDPSRATAAAVGGVRDGNKFFNPSVKITAEPSGNRLIINAEYEDYLKLRELLEKLDVEQPQVALKIMILDVDLTNAQQLGTQIRNSKECCDGSGGTSSVFGNNINAQFTGLNGVITREAAPGNNAFVSGAERLLGNLIQIANLPSGGGPGLFGTGTTLISLGKDIFGFWGLLRVLESITRVSVVANPFLVTSNKYKAEVTVGETRRVLTSIVQAQSSQTGIGNLDANLSVVITPQISYDDMITMNIYVELTQFTTGGELPTRLTKQVSTEAIAKNREVVALGGLIRETISEQEVKVPILGDVPLLGWFFKNKVKTSERTSIVILISPEIIKPHQPEIGREFTQYQLNSVKDTLYTMYYPQEERDPIHRWFFGDHKDRTIADIDKFSSTSSRYAYVTDKEQAAAETALEQSTQTEQKKHEILSRNKSNKKSISLLDALDNEPSTKELR